MSMIKYYKNFILCGDLNYHCLVCQENITTQESVERHLRWEKHRKALKTQTCMPQFRNEFIYKLDPYYYCSVCNRTMQDIVDIKKHIDSDIHKNYKNNSTTTSRVEVKKTDEEIFIKNFHIGHFQWHGVINGQCMFCNVPVNALSGHVMTREHVVRLIQARVNYVDDKYYRKINNHHFQCFSCENIFPIQTFEEHFSNHTNNNAIENLPLLNGDMKLNPSQPRIDKDGEEVKDCTMADSNDYPVVLCGTGMNKIYNTEWSIRLLAGLEDDYFDIDMDNEKLTCKTCKKQVKVTLNDITDHMFSHREYHMNNSTVYNAINKYIKSRYVQRSFNHGAARSKAAQYGKANYIKLNEGGSKAYCTLCDKFLSPSLDVFKGHTNGCFHRNHLELKGLRVQSKHEQESYKPVIMTEVIKTLAYSADQKAFMINGMILMHEDSFFLMKRIELGKHYMKTKCFACNETMLPAEEKEHCISWKHKSKLLAAKCISEDRPDHLPIREICPKLYHCGVCNESLPYWDTLKKHTKQMSHSMNCRKSVSAMLKKYGFSKIIELKTDKDNIYMQLLNAVFNTKYVIKL